MHKMRFCFLLMFATGVFAAEGALYFANAEQSQQYQILLKELRCVTCPNQSLNDSSMPVAMGMKAEIYKQVQDHKSSQEIKDYFVSRYGKRILYKPAYDRTTFILWSTPIILFMVVLVCWRRYFNSSVKNA